ncbi:hypothetical protein AGMMS50212_01020 [Spirochaetia bacterium]|nr:hypothetical protein AGMMS50212_01020 [Spirochaetia bacterium]
MKKSFSIFWTIFVLMFLPAAIFSQDKYVIDNGNRLNESEINALNERLTSIKNTYKFNVVILTEKEMADWEEEELFADNFFNDKFGYESPGVLLIWGVNLGWLILTYGRGPMGGNAIIDRDALIEAGKDYLVNYLISDTNRAFSAFIDDVEKYLVHAAQKIYVNDGLHILTGDQINALNARITAIKNAYDFDVVLVSEESIYGEEPMVYADDFFDYRYGGFGNGENGGVLMLWVKDIRWAWFSGFGLTPLGGETVFNDFTIGVCDKHIDKYLKADEGGVDDIYGMYNRFLDDAEKFLKLAAQGKSYNILYEYLHVFLIILWAIALLISLIVVNVWKVGMNTALGSREAAAYIVPGSLKVTNKNDTFLYSTVSKTAKSSSSSSGGSSGGSHRSSSGRSHSGGGGRH